MIMSKYSANGKRGSGCWDEDTKAQPLSNLYQYNMIMSPTHEDEEHEGKTPVVGRILDFDEDAVEGPKFMKKVSHDDVSSNSSDRNAESKKAVGVPVDSNGKGNDDDDFVSLDESILSIAMFEGVFHASTDGCAKDEIITADDEEIIPLPAGVANSSKRPPERDQPRPFKIPKTAPVSLPGKGSGSAPQQPAGPTLQDTALAVVDEQKKLPPRPRRRRPNCLFVNHFGTRLNNIGQVVKVNVLAKTHYGISATRVSSEETASIRTKVTASTARSSKASCDMHSKKTPVKDSAAATAMGSNSVPSVVRIVTPNMKKPIKSSCLEDITMEEDIMEPIKHDDPMEEGDDMLNRSHLPYLNSLSEHPSHASTPPSPATARMMHSMMPPGMHMSFSRPFPLLQRRAFLVGCHPMTPHPVAAFATGPGWHPAFAPGQGMPFPNQLAGYHHIPPSSNPATLSEQQGKWQKQQPQREHKPSS